MPYDGYEPIKIEKFGGLNALIDPTNLPIFASPDCQDVEFIYGLVRTRPGIVSQFAPLANNPTVNYLKTYVTNALAIRMLALDSLGNFYKENPQGTLNLVSAVENALVYANSVSLFGREYLAIGDGKFGTSIPRQFDDTNFDRVSQVGPGAPPVAIDESVSLGLLGSPNGALMLAAQTIPASPSGVSESGNTVTVFVGVPFGIVVGDTVVIAGVTNASYNGTFKVTAIDNVASTFQYYNPTSGLAASGGGTADFQRAEFITTAANPFAVGQLVAISGVGTAGFNGTWTVRQILSNTIFIVVINTTGLANSGGGTAAAAGSVITGVHKLACIFVTRSGAFTFPSPTFSWNAAGSKRAVITNIPIGPPNVLQRILLFTASGGASFFYQTSAAGLFSASFIINDNTTTTTTVDFSDTTLLAGTNADLLFRQVELGECSGVFASPSGTRLLWTGERKKDTNGGNFVNLTFDGGFSQATALPLGWTPDPNPFLSNFGGTEYVNVVWGGAYVMLGNGVQATIGLITQSAYQDYLGNPILQPNVQYSVRARITRNNLLTQGTIHVNLFSTSGGINTTGLQVTAAQATTTYQEFTAVLTAPIASPPTDLVLRVFTDGTPTLNGKFYIDNIEIFPTTQPYAVTQVRVSKASQPEVYDGIDGFIDVWPSNGQATRTGFVIRNNIYLVKERSLYVTQDDGTNEPALWNIQEVSAKVGTLSVRGVGIGDEWAIIAGKDGVYYFDGSEPQKISQEIQPTWDQINWAFGYLIDVKVDTKRKRVYIDVPFGTSTVNNRKFTLDYTDGFGDPNPTNTVNIAGIGRKWVPWTGSVVGNSQNLILRADGTQPLFIGSGTANGKIYGLDATGTVFTDDGAKINDYWQSGYFQDNGRLDFGYLTANVVGQGSLGIVLRKGDQGWLGNARSWFMQSTGFRNLERQINITTERMAIRLGSVGVGDHFSLQGLAAYARASVSAPLRGINV